MTSKESPQPIPMLWACLHFSDLPLHAVFEDGDEAQPCAVVDGPQQRQHLVYLNAVARRAGLRADQPLAAARALCAQLHARARDVAAEKRLLLSLAAWAYRFSSHVSLSEPHALLLEVGASLNLFGGWAALERRLRGELAAVGYAPTLAVAPVPAAARTFALRHDGFFVDQRETMLAALGNVPLAYSGLSEDAITLLHKVGLSALREAFALPRPEFARRSGPAALAALDRLRGIDTEILPLYRPPDRFAHRIEFDHLIEAWPPLLFPLKRLTGELALFLAARDGGVQRCELVLEHEGGAATRLPIELLTPQREAHTLYELIRGRLERAALVAPVNGIALIATDLPTLRPQHRDLFEPQRAQALAWPELAERLRAHLGDEAVRRLALAADHRPERAWSRLLRSRDALKASAGLSVRTAELARGASDRDVASNGIARNSRGRGGMPSGDAAGMDVGCFHPRPLWLLHQPIPLRGTPPHLLAGPERIESGWWDGGDARRDYYVVETREGQRAWVFTAPGERDGWMLHGWFA